MNAHLLDLFEKAFSEFLARDRSLLAKDINERCLCGRLAIYLQNIADTAGLEQYYADVDYNRNLNDPKRIIGDTPGKDKMIIADLILHSRAELPDDNLIAIEMKKSTRSAPSKATDRRRLEVLTLPEYNKKLWPGGGDGGYVHGYHLGIYIEVSLRRREFLSTNTWRENISTMRPATSTVLRQRRRSPKLWVKRMMRGSRYLGTCQHNEARR